MSALVAIDTPWTMLEIDRAAKLWAAGKSSIEITRALKADGGFRTEGAVRALMMRNRPRFPMRAPDRPIVARAPETMPLPDRKAGHCAFDAASLRLPLAALGARQCRFPVNEAAPGETHLFCGHAMLRGRYCAHHADRVSGKGTESERSAWRVLMRAEAA